MDEITIVKRRSRLWPVLLAILLLAAIVLAVMWLSGNQPAADIGWNDIIECSGRYTSGTT